VLPGSVGLLLEFAFVQAVILRSILTVDGRERSSQTASIRRSIVTHVTVCQH